MPRRVAEVDCASDPTDPWCAFVADTTDRAAGVDCAADPTHAWCACIASAEEQLGALFTTDMSAVIYADWLGDGNCHTIFDTGACHSDGGDCGSTHIRACATALTGGVRSACCSTSDCDPLPEHVSKECAEVMLPFWAECEYETELPYHPAWVWAGLAVAAQTTLERPSGQCADSGATYSQAQECDAVCDCADCSDEPTECVYPHTGALCTALQAGQSNEDRVCTCNSGAEIPFEWLCDGSSDCGMHEDETAEACAEDPLRTALTLWGDTYAVTGENQDCIVRWQREVGPACSGIGSSGVGDSSCSAACADEFVGWFFDCKQTVMNTTASALGVSQQETANGFFDCCTQASATSATVQCAAPANDVFVGCMDDGTTVPVAELNNGVCEGALDCDVYLSDGGDCAQSVTITLPFEVTGAFSPADFVDALIAPTPDNDFMQEGDISVLEFEQTITGSLNLGCGFDGAVSALLLSGTAGLAQLRSGIGSWLAVGSDAVSIGAIEDVTVSGNQVVSVEYTVVAPKDVSEALALSPSGCTTGCRTAAVRQADLLAHLADATPQAMGSFPTCSSAHYSADVVSSYNTSTSIRVRVSVMEDEFELTQGLLVGTDPERATAMQTTMVSALQNNAQIVEKLNEAVGCDDQSCISVAPVTDDDVDVEVVVPEGHVIAELTESEAALALAIIIIIVVGGVACCVILCLCTVYWYKKKQQRKILVVDQKGNIIKEFEDESDNAEREVLMQVLHHYIAQQEEKVAAEQKHEEEELVATLEAYEIIEEANESEAAGDNLLDLANAEAKAAKAARERKRKEAQEKLAKRRAALLEKQKAALVEGGADEAAVEEVFAEVIAADEEADGHREDLEEKLDQDEIDATNKKRQELQAALDGASSDEERARLQEQFEADMESEKRRLAAERDRQRKALNDRLAKRKAKVKEHVEEQLAAVDDSTLSDQAAERDALEDEAAAAASEASGELAAAFMKDKAELDKARKAKKAAAKAKLEERRKKMKDKHKKQLIDAGAPEQVVEKQAKELDDLAALEDKQLQQQEAVMKKKEAAALAKAEKEAKEKMDAAADEETRAAVTAQYQKDVAAQKAKHAAGRKAQRSKLNERLAKRKAAMANKHKQELEEKAPQAAVVAEQQEEEREKFDAMKKQLHASQEELAEEKAKHQADLEALSAKHDEELRIQQNKFAEMQRKFDDLASQKFENVQSTSNPCPTCLPRRQGSDLGCGVGRSGWVRWGGRQRHQGCDWGVPDDDERCGQEDQGGQGAEQSRAAKAIGGTPVRQLPFRVFALHSLEPRKANLGWCQGDHGGEGCGSDAAYPRLEFECDYSVFVSDGTRHPAAAPCSASPRRPAARCPQYRTPESIRLTTLRSSLKPCTLRLLPNLLGHGSVSSSSMSDGDGPALRPAEAVLPRGLVETEIVPPDAADGWLMAAIGRLW